MSAYPVNLTDEDDGTVVVTSPDFSERNDLRSGSGRRVGVCRGRSYRDGCAVVTHRADMGSERSGQSLAGDSSDAESPLICMRCHASAGSFPQGATLRNFTSDSRLNSHSVIVSPGRCFPPRIKSS